MLPTDPVPCIDAQTPQNGPKNRLGTQRQKRATAHLVPTSLWQTILPSDPGHVSPKHDNSEHSYLAGDGQDVPICNRHVWLDRGIFPVPTGFNPDGAQESHFHVLVDLKKCFHLFPVSSSSYFGHESLRRLLEAVKENIIVCIRRKIYVSSIVIWCFCSLRLLWDCSY